MFRIKKKTLEENTQYVKSIIENYSNSNQTKKLISPISDEYFIIDDTNEIYICIKDSRVILSNHVFLYKKNFSLSFTDELKKLVRESIENEMQALKKSLFKNETDLLSKVLEISTKDKKVPVIKTDFKAAQNM